MFFVFDEGRIALVRFHFDNADLALFVAHGGAI